MALKNRLLLTVFVIFLPLSCGGGFSYRYYNIVPSKDVLLGEDESGKDDRSLSECEPDEKDKSKCVAMFSSEFEKLRLEYAELKERLIRCEKGR